MIYTPMIVKEFLLDELNYHLSPKGYTLYSTGEDPTFVKIEEDYTVFFYFNFKTSGSVYFSRIHISIPLLEQIILEIKHPFLNYKDVIDNKKYFLTSVIDNKNLIEASYTFDDCLEIKSPKDLSQISHQILNYLNGNGLDFIKQYSKLPNILEEMDILQNNGMFWNDLEKGILKSGIPGLFRGLIISKVCNDDDYFNKVKWLKEKLNKESNKPWIPYCNDLLSRLDSM